MGIYSSAANVADKLFLLAGNGSVRDDNSRPQARLSRDDSCMKHARNCHVICSDLSNVLLGLLMKLCNFQRQCDKVYIT